jgi:hypothetical protein
MEIRVVEVLWVQAFIFAINHFLLSYIIVPITRSLTAKREEITFVSELLTHKSTQKVQSNKEKSCRHQSFTGEKLDIKTVVAIKAMNSTKTHKSNKTLIIAETQRGQKNEGKIGKTA